MVVKIDKVIADGGERDQMSDFAKPLQSISTSNNNIIRNYKSVRFTFTDSLKRLSCSYLLLLPVALITNSCALDAIASS